MNTFFNKAKLFSLVILSTIFINGQMVKLNQKKGIYQDDKLKQVQFGKIEIIKFDFDKVPLKKVKQIVLHDNKIFILDGERWELYVMDKRGKHLYTVGRPGQGPGDLEYPSYFFISTDNKIYVLNSIPRRIEVFSIDGSPIRSVRLDSPTAWTFPDSFIVSQDKKFIIGSALNHLVYINESNGGYKETILKRKKELDETGINTGVPSYLTSFKGDILHFDRFRGIFRHLNIFGNIKIKFSGYHESADKKMRQIEKELEKRKKKGFSSTNMFIFWTNFCIDENNHIFVLPLSKSENDVREMFVFSPEGNLLYKKNLSFLKNKFIHVLSCDSQCFIFITRNLDFIVANRRKN